MYAENNYLRNIDRILNMLSELTQSSAFVNWLKAIILLIFSRIN